MVDQYARLTVADALPCDEFDWGRLRWLCNQTLIPGAVQTLGMCEIWPGKSNPLHYHPNCEELLYLLSGQGRHRLDADVLDLVAGTTLRIPAGVRHNLENTGTDVLVCLVSFSSGDRQTVFV